VVVILCILHWGGSFLISTDPLPAHAQAAIVLQGSIAGEKARLDGALQLASQGIVDRVLVSVPRESYWGQAIPPVARQFIERNYGRALADRVDFCETGAGVDSTEQEAAVLIPCIQQQGWRSIIVVTSNYHTRRAGSIWRKQIRKEDPGTTTCIYGVPDQDFHEQAWWRDRRSAKTWFFESTKLVWMWIVG
jgi:uncharacterized SAM-binding protein YcdF (DUF218 family)